MARPTARVLALLEILQGGGVHRVTDLAASLEVDERTVRRYVGHLVGLDVPVRSLRGPYGGYRLEPGYRLPPLMLTDDEALAVLLGLHTGRSRGGAAESASAKIRRVLPTPSRTRLESLVEGIPVDDEGAAPTVSARTLLTLSEAVRRHTPVEIAYSSREGRPSRRAIHPYGLVSHRGRWYLPAYDTESGEVRTFRADRVERTRTLRGAFDVPAGLEAEALVLDSLASTPWRYDVVVRVDGSLAEVTERLPPGLGVVSELPDGVRLRVRAERLDWVPGMLIGLDLPFVVEAPDELADLLRALSQRLAQAVRRRRRKGSVRAVEV